VVTTRTGGIPEATGDQCIYHEAGNVSDLTRALDEALNMAEPQRRKLSEEAREFAMRFDRAAVFGNLVKMLATPKPAKTAQVC